MVNRLAQYDNRFNIQNVENLTPTKPVNWFNKKKSKQLQVANNTPNILTQSNKLFVKLQLIHAWPRICNLIQFRENVLKITHLLCPCYGLENPRCWVPTNSDEYCLQCSSGKFAKKSFYQQKQVIWQVYYKVGDYDEH